jgi:hypothetical protein
MLADGMLGRWPDDPLAGRRAICLSMPQVTERLSHASRPSAAECCRRRAGPVGEADRERRETG